MTVQEIKQKVHRNGDTKRYRQILAELNDVPVSVINAVLDDTLMPKWYCISDGEVQKAQKISVYTPKKYVEKTSFVREENANSVNIEKQKETQQQISVELQKKESTIKGLKESIKKQEEKIKFKEKELSLEKGVLERLQRDLKAEEEINEVLKRMQ